MKNQTMQKAEFDKFADEYYVLHQKNIRHSGEAPEFLAEYKIRDIFELLMNQTHKPQRILDFGAGIGTSVPHFRRFFPDASLTCLDVSEKSLEAGRTRFPSLADFQSFDGIRIPSPDNAFDLVSLLTYFIIFRIPPTSTFSGSERQVLNPSGTAVIFEHNSLNPQQLML